MTIDCTGTFWKDSTQSEASKESLSLTGMMSGQSRNRQQQAKFFWAAPLLTGQLRWCEEYICPALEELTATFGLDYLRKEQ